MCPAEMSPRDKKAFQRALAGGTTTFVHGRIIIVGPGRGGKSALLRSLLRKVFQKLKSTIGIDVKKARCFLSSKGGKIEFRVDESDQQIVRLACRVIKDELKKEEVPSVPLPSDQPNPNSTSKACSPVIESPPLGTPISNSSLTSSHVSIDMTDSDLQPSAKPDISQKVSDELDDFITKLYEASMLDSDYLDSRVCLDLWDFAGQKPFQALGRMFFDDERCCFIVVFDARKVLQNEIFTDLFCDEDGEDLDLETSSTTYVANFEKWLNVIHQVAGEDSPVYVVGTHTDEFPDEEHAAKLEEVESLIEQMAKKNAYGTNLKKVFLLTNKGSGTEKEDPKLEELREAVFDSAQEKFKVPVPISWLPFSVVARRFADNHHQRILSAGDTSALAQAACRDPNVEVNALLKFYQALGQILRSESGVVIDTYWLMKAAGMLFAPLKFEKQEPARRDEYRQLFDDGILSESLAIHRWGENTNTKELSTDAKKRALIFQLLAQHKLVHEMNEGDTSASTMDKQCKYLVPFLVRNLSVAPPAGSEKPTPPHYIICEERKVFPEISFWCSVVSMMQDYGLRHADLVMYRDAAQLTVDDRFQLRLRHMNRGIQLSIGDEEGDIQSLAEKSKEIVNKLLQSANHFTASSRLKACLYHAASCLCGRSTCVAHSIAGCSEFGCLHFSLLKDVNKAMRCPLPGNHRAMVADSEELLRFWLPANCKLVSGVWLWTFAVSC